MLQQGSLPEERTSSIYLIVFSAIHLFPVTMKTDSGKATEQALRHSRFLKFGEAQLHNYFL